MWERKGVTPSERFLYLYSQDELEECVSPIQKLAQQAQRVHVLKSNCHRDCPVRNTRQMAKLLGTAREQPPSPQPRLL